MGEFSTKKTSFWQIQFGKEQNTLLYREPKRTEHSFIENEKNGTFFYREQKRMEHSFQKNGKNGTFFSKNIGCPTLI